MTAPKPFENPVYVTRPALPDRQDVFGKIDEIWRSRWLTNSGPQHGLLEKRLEDRLGVPGLSLFCNGTLALQIGCQALRLSGEVITTPFTYAATAHVLHWNGVTPVFCDIEQETLNLDPCKVEAAVGPRTSAILAVHVFGYPCDVGAFEAIAGQYGLKVIYDAAHCFGVELGGRGIGTFGDISMFSFHATKTFHTVEGGALTYRDPELGDRLELARNCGYRGEETIVVPGLNAKMNEIQAAIGLLMLKEFDREVARRKRLTEIYRDRLKELPGIVFRQDLPFVKHNYHCMSIRIEKRFGIRRDELYTALREYNIFARKYFYPLCSHFECYRGLPSASSTNLPVAEGIANEVLSLPLHGQLSADDVHRICDILAFLRESAAGGGGEAHRSA